MHFNLFNLFILQILFQNYHNNALIHSIHLIDSASNELFKSCVPFRNQIYIPLNCVLQINQKLETTKVSIELCKTQPIKWLLEFFALSCYEFQSYLICVNFNLNNIKSESKIFERKPWWKRHHLFFRYRILYSWKLIFFVKKQRRPNTEISNT